MPYTAELGKKLGDVESGSVARVFQVERVGYNGEKVIYTDVTDDVVKQAYTNSDDANFAAQAAGKKGVGGKLNQQALEGLNEGAGNNNVADIGNIHNYLAGNKNFDDVVDDYAKIYAERVNRNQIWRWDEDIVGGASLSVSQKSRIKAAAIRNGYIPEIVVRKDNGRSYADFKRAGVVKQTLVLPKKLWYITDAKQFEWLDGQIGGRIAGYTWHHTEIPGVMELVPFGIHNVTYHNGGRTFGLWADAPR